MSRNCARRIRSSRSARAVCAWSKSTASAVTRRRARLRCAPGMKVRTESPALARLRRGVMELYISDHPLDCLTCPANGNCELQDMAGAVGLREVRYRNGDGANHLHAAKDRIESVFHFRSVEMHRVLAMRPRVRGSAGHVRADDRRARIFVGDFAGTERSVLGVRVRFVRRLRASVSDRDVDGKIGGRTRTAGSQRRHDLRILRRRMLVPRRDEGRPRRADGAEPQRAGQSRPLVRQRPLRVGLHDASRSRYASDDSQIDRRAVARGFVARSDRIRRVGVQAHPGKARARRGRRDYVLAMHQRGNFSRAETGARRVRQQQRRYLRARLSFADRLRAQDRVRHLGDDAGFRIGDAVPT